MKKTRIHLSQPFEEIVALVLSLPKAPGASSGTGPDGEDVKRVVRGLYEAANGRYVETILGTIPVAPPVAPFLKEQPFDVETQLDFLVAAASRVLTGPSRIVEISATGEPIGHTNGQFPTPPSETDTPEKDSTRALDHRRIATFATSL
jgi:hypothetical protein